MQVRNKLWMAVLAVVAALISVIFVSTPSQASGTTPAWQRVNLPNGSYAGHVVDAVGFTDGWHGWLSGSLDRSGRPDVCGVWTTKNGGGTWTLRVPHMPGVVLNCVVSFGDSIHGWLVVNRRSSATVFSTANDGRTWTRRATLTGTVRGLAAADRTHAWAYGDDGFFARTTNGVTWSTRPVPGGAEGACCVQFVDARHGWVTADGRLYATADGGQTWARLPQPGAAPFNVTVDFVSRSVGWASIPHGVLKTTDGGHTWTHVLRVPALRNVMPLAFSAGGHGWVFRAAQAVGTQDGGKTWTDRRLGYVSDAAAAGCNTVAVRANGGVDRYVRRCT